MKNYFSSYLNGVLAMAKEPKTLEEIKQWQRDFKKIQLAWIDWLRANEAHHKSIEEAWLAYKAQWQGTIFMP